MDIESKLGELYEKVFAKESNEIERSNYYYSIIQIKKLNREYEDYRHSAYQDVKGFVACYISSTVYRDLGNDVINLDKILNLFSDNFGLKEKYLLSKHTYRILANNNYEQESKEVKIRVNCFKHELLKSEPYRFGKYLKMFLHKSS